MDTNSDKWLEQGNVTAVAESTGEKTIPLVKPFANTNYTVTYSRTTTSTGEQYGAYVGDISIYSKATNQFKVSRGYNTPILWIAVGYTV